VIGSRFSRSPGMRLTMPTFWPRSPFLIFSILFLLVCTHAGAADHRSNAREANKLEDACRKQYLAGNYDRALETCLKEKQLSVGANLSGLLGAMYARKGDMQQAYVSWGSYPDNGSMGGIPEPQARLAAQHLARLLGQWTSVDDVDYKARGITAADGLVIILRKYGFNDDADKVAQEGERLRRGYAADRASGPSTFSSFMSAIATGLSGAPAPMPTPSRTADSDGASPRNSNASGTGGQAALHENCMLKTAIFNPRSTLLVLKNVCNQAMSVYWCFQSPDGTGWACSPDSVSSGATTANSSQQIGALCEIDRGWGKTHGCQGVPPWPVVFNATYASEGQAPKPNVNDSSQHSVH
jgi:hypothetical protein